MPDAYRLRAMIAEEQAEFAELLRGLDDTQWESASLCEGWSVHDVVIHIAWHTHNTDVARNVELARNRFSFERMHVPKRLQPKDQLIDSLAAPAVLCGSNNLLTQLAELIVHQQDVRRPLGIVRTIPEARLAPALDFAVTRIGSLSVAGGYKRSKGLRLVATDMPWFAGAGPEVRGPAEAIFMAINGRTAALPDLEGEGTTKLRGR
jgi:uncharacterized protein (TIGR03083 family)